MSSTNAQFPPIYTDRLMIRIFDPSRPSDYDAVLDIYNSDYTIRAVGDIGLHTRTQMDLRCKKEKPYPADRSQPSPNYPWHLVYLRSDPSTPIGVTSLFHHFPFSSPDLGYAVREHVSGQGYASEAGRAVLKWWTEEIGIKDIWAGTLDSHKASQRVAAKIGFVDGGKLTVKYPNGDVKEGVYFVLPGAKKNKDGLTVDFSQSHAADSSTK